MQNLVILMEPSNYSCMISEKAGNMCLNRFCIDEDSAFELSGVDYLKRTSYETSYFTKPSKGKGYSSCFQRYHTLIFSECFIAYYSLVINHRLRLFE